MMQESLAIQHEHSYLLMKTARSTHTNTPSSRLEKKRKRSNKEAPKPPLYSILSFAALILIIIYAVGSQLSKPERLVQKFEEAVHNKDYEYITDVMNDGQDELTADEEDAKAFVAYLTNDKALFDKTMKSLRSSYLDGPSYTGQAVKPFISLQQEGRSWLFFDRYTLKMETYEAELSTNHKNVSFYIGSKKIGTTKSADDTVKTGPLFPGIYTFKAAANEAYSPLETKEKVDVTKSIQNKVQVYLELKGKYIYPSSNYENAHLFVNGKDTGLEIGNIEEFGPISTDGSVTIHAEKIFKNGVKRSKAVTVEDETDIYLPIEEDHDEAKEETKTDVKGISDLLKEYISSFLAGQKRE